MVFHVIGLVAAAVIAGASLEVGRRMAKTVIIPLANDLKKSYKEAYDEYYTEQKAKKRA